MSWLTELFWDLGGSPGGSIMLTGVALGIAHGVLLWSTSCA